jgi:hypothetical protein
VEFRRSDDPSAFLRGTVGACHQDFRHLAGSRTRVDMAESGGSTTWRLLLCEPDGVLVVGSPGALMFKRLIFAVALGAVWIIPVPASAQMT